eukprot:1743935-Pleurochrysis_carterae.AAC.1
MPSYSCSRSKKEWDSNNDKTQIDENQGPELTRRRGREPGDQRVGGARAWPRLLARVFALRDRVDNLLVGRRLRRHHLNRRRRACGRRVA